MSGIWSSRRSGMVGQKLHSWGRALGYRCSSLDFCTPRRHLVLHAASTFGSAYASITDAGLLREAWETNMRKESKGKVLVTIDTPPNLVLFTSREKY
jgi:hypothetical protein